MSRPRAYSKEDLKVTEKGLLEELKREAYVPEKDKCINRVRHKGELILHSKQILLLIVILNLIDCGLVLGEIILDIYYVREVQHETDTISQHFIDEMQSKYPADIQGYTKDSMDYLYDKIYEANCTWGDGARAVRSVEGLDGVFGIERDKREVADTGDTETADELHYDHEEHKLYEDVAHGLHKASITILGILCAENLVKLFCMGFGFFHKKLEVFDGFVVVVSFVVDLVLLKGVTEFPVQEALFILSLLLPWRVIRVVNSLIVAVLDQEHFRLKMMYKEKKLLEIKYLELKNLEKKWDFHLQKIEAFCESEGIPKWKIRQHTAMGRRQSTVSSMASLAFSGIVNGLVLSQQDKNSFDNHIGRSISTTVIDTGHVNNGFDSAEDLSREKRDTTVINGFGPETDTNTNNSTTDLVSGNSTPSEVTLQPGFFLDDSKENNENKTGKPKK